MRILSVTPYYEPEGGGLERYAHEILRRLAQRGHRVEALASTRSGLAGGERDGVRVARHAPWFTMGNSPIDPELPARVKRAIRRFQPDVVLAHTPVPFPAEMAFLAARKAGVPFVATYHAGRLRGSSRGLDALATIDRSTLERRMLAGSARLIAVGPFVRDHALARHRDRVAIIPPGVDGSRFCPAGLPSGRDVLFVGPLAHSYRWKGIDTLWRAFQLVRQAVPDARLTLVGQGDRVPEFSALAAASPESLRLLGHVSDDELVAAYRQASVVVLPSVTEAESFGMVLAEANACGKPVVASRVGGIPDFVRHGDNGLLARPGDASDLAHQIIMLLQDPPLARQMGSRGRERVLKAHAWGDLARATENVLVEATGTGAGVPSAAQML